MPSELDSIDSIPSITQNSCDVGTSSDRVSDVRAHHHLLLAMRAFSFGLGDLLDGLTSAQGVRPGDELQMHVEDRLQAGNPEPKAENSLIRRRCDSSEGGKALKKPGFGLGRRPRRELDIANGTRLAEKFS